MTMMVGPSRPGGRLSRPAPRSRPAQLENRTTHHRRCAPAALPSFIPEQYAAEVKEPAARQMLERLRRVELQVPTLGSVQTAYVGPDQPSSEGPVFVLLHGFDSSLLEFRRFLPLLGGVGDAHAVDLAGWGFSDCGFAENPEMELGPQQKRAHLLAFCQQVVGRPVVLVGTSLGGAVAVDFALHHPEMVDKLILIDAQGFIDGIGLLASMPRFLSVLGVQVLRTVALRQLANKIAYFDKARYATEDAMRIGRLHTHLPGWTDANVAFMRSGGYAVSRRMGEVRCPVLVVWGRQDEILEPSYAGRFLEELPDARLVWVDECGHVPALEQPQQLLAAVKDFVGAAAAASV